MKDWRQGEALERLESRGGRPRALHGRSRSELEGFKTPIMFDHMGAYFAIEIVLPREIPFEHLIGLKERIG